MVALSGIGFQIRRYSQFFINVQSLAPIWCKLLLVLCAYLCDGPSLPFEKGLKPMPLLDKDGRLLGRLNVFDLFVVCVVVAFVLIAYFKLSAPNRVAPPFASPQNSAVALVALQLPMDQPWLCDSAKPGTGERDARTGELMVEVLDGVVRDGFPVIDLRVHVVRDDADRLLFEGQPLLPGRMLEINTDVAIFSGVVRSVVPEAP